MSHAVDTPKALGALIRAGRKQLGLTQVGAADRSDRSRGGRRTGRSERRARL